MKTKPTLLLILVSASLLIQSCSTPKNIISLEPDREPDKWLFGQAFVSDSIFGIHYEVGFDRLENNRYQFDFHITNRSNMPILIDPASFYCLPCDSSMEPLTENGVNAIDPEIEILEIDKHLSRNEARQKNQFGVAVAAVSVGVAAAIITHTDDNPNNDHLAHDISGDLVDDVRISDMESEFEAFDLNELRHTWSNSTIRKTTLDSNYAMYGKVLFPAFPQAAFLQIFLPVDDELIQFTFKQLQLPAQ
ncbi:hypothetical protein [Gaoshiqia sediminis]|uniref:DUF3298 domain-containing protein n=1 Tax=Gaoshiqia sediminis TaxID=2986998 RepID=A0AA41YEV2_9BACT|nr:hypothetical protein [Gaoshiqia sediminis]MCW0484707.1 hypothetical protein [Gaoshiqia sediminis]